MGSPAGLLLRPSSQPRARRCHEHACDYYGTEPSYRVSQREYDISPSSAPVAIADTDTPPTGYDADLVLWDSHPLALGATPHEVWIDGVPQLSRPASSSPVLVPDTKPAALQALPKVPNFDAEAINALNYDGLPPLESTAANAHAHTIVFANVSAMFFRTSGSASVERHPDINEAASMSVVVRAGRVVCVGLPSSLCVHEGLHTSNVKLVDLAGGAISPGLTTYGSMQGIEEIQGEASTRDGHAPDGLDKTVLGLPGASGGLVRAVDGLQFATRHA